MSESVRVRPTPRRSCFTLCSAEEDDDDDGDATVAPLHSTPLTLSAARILNYILEIVFGLKYLPAPGEWAGAGAVGLASLWSSDAGLSPLVRA